MIKRRLYAALIATLVIACGPSPSQPPPDTRLLLRQRSLGTVLEMAIEDTRIDVVVTKKDDVIERAVIKISSEDATSIRRLFWDAFCHPPMGRLMPVRDLVFEQEWRGAARSYEILIQGPLTSYDYTAYDHLNRLVPARYRFLVDFGPQRRSRTDR